MTRRPGHPLISVVMPVHNALPYLDQAIESILHQTRTDFEFVIYDDDSTDGSYERLLEWQPLDSRIKLFRGAVNLGPAASSNEVIRYASAPLIARMDADDISYPDRLERQAEVLSAKPDVGIVGSLCDVIDPLGRQIRSPELWRLVRKSWFTPFPHGSMMFRREMWEALGGYRDECEFWEDLDFVLRASDKYRILVFPRALYCYRQSPSSTRIASQQLRVEHALDLRYRSIARFTQNETYDELLSEEWNRNRRVDPRVFASLALLSLWSNHRPNIIRRFFRRARIGADAATFMSLLSIFWARLSPGSLKMVLHFTSKLRNAAVRPKPSTDEPIEWRVPQ